MKIIGLSRVLSEIRLSGVGLGDRDGRALCKALVSTSGRAVSKLDLSNNFLGDSSSKSFAKLVLKYERLMYINLTWNRFSKSGTDVLQKAVARRHTEEEEEKQRQQRFMLELNDPVVTAAGGPEKSLPTTAASKSRLKRAPSSDFKARASAVFSDALEVKIEIESPHGPRDGMYDFDRLNNKTLTQVIEYLDHLRLQTKWDDLPEDEERKVDRDCKVLLDVRADGPDVHVKSPSKSLKRKSPQKGQGPLTNTSEEALLLDQQAYLDLKAQLADHESEGMQTEDRLAIMRMYLKGKRLRVLQVWELLLPFLGTNTLYAAKRFLNSRLSGQAEVEKVEALQEVFEKPRHEVFIPEDSRLPANSSRRRRAKTPSENYLDPAAIFLPKVDDPDKLMGNIRFVFL